MPRGMKVVDPKMLAEKIDYWEAVAANILGNIFMRAPTWQNRITDTIISVSDLPSYKFSGSIPGDVPS